MAKHSIHPTADIHPRAEIGEEVAIGPYCVVGEGVRLGRGTKLLSHVTIQGIAELGEGNLVYPHAVLGTDPQDRKYKGEATRLEVGDRNIFREFVTVNRGTPGGHGVTRLGNRNILLACSHVAHDCELEDGIVLDAKVLLAGHVRIESAATLGGRVAVHQFVTIGRLAFVGGNSGISQDVPPFMMADGNPPHWILGVNEKGLTRAGISTESIRAVREAFKLLYKSGTVFSQAIEEMVKREGSHPEIQYLARFLRASETGRHGRALEALRDHAQPEEEEESAPGGAAELT